MPVVNDYFTMIVGGILCGQPVENVLHFYDVSAGAVDIFTLSNDLNTQWDAIVKPKWLDVHPDNYQYLGTKVRRSNTGGGPTLGKLAPAGTMGNRPSSASDSAIGPVLIAPFTRAGKWLTARIFINGAGDDDLDNNVFSPALLAALNALSAVLVAPFGAAGPQWQYCAIEPPTATHPLNNQGVSVKPGVQNRRLKPTF